MRAEESIEVHAPPEAVWALMADPEQILQWYTPLERFEYLTEDRGAGALLRFVERTPLGRMDLYCVITKWVDTRTIAFRMISGNFLESFEERWTVEPSAAGSIFTFTMQGEISFGLVGKLLTRFAERRSDAVVARMLSALQSLAEA